MGDPERNMGFTTTCRVGVDLDTIIVLFQSMLTSFGLLADCANRVVVNRTRESAFLPGLMEMSRRIKWLSITARQAACRP
jgi:hypothetical protein